MELTESLWVLGAMTVVFGTLFVLGRNELNKREVVCPRSGGPANVDVIHRYHHPEKALRVKRCSLLPKAKVVDCAQDCLKQQG